MRDIALRHFSGGESGQSRAGGADLKLAGTARAMTILYELLGNVLTAIEPRNERSRTWLDKVILRAHMNSQGKLNAIIARASLEILRNDFQFFRITQGSDPSQQELYGQAEHLFRQLECAMALPFDDPRRGVRATDESVPAN